MKIKLLSALLGSLMLFTSNAQNSFFATYTITHPISMTGEGGKLIPLTFNFEGRIFSKNNKVLIYMRPADLEKYPDGKITITYPGGISSHTFGTDSMHMPELYHTDSLRKWAGYNYIGNSKLNEYITFKYDPDYWKWEILPEMKVINGFNCQRAKYYYPNKKSETDVWWDIWFYKDISFPFSFMSLQNAPGLVVEADNRQSNHHFVLNGFETKVEIPEETFWPPMFKNARFVNLGNPQTPKEKKQDNKDEKRLKIMGQ